MEYVEARLILISVHATPAKPPSPASSSRTVLRSNGRWQRQVWEDEGGGKTWERTGGQMKRKREEDCTREQD